MASPIGIFGGTIMVRRRVFLGVLMTITVLALLSVNARSADVEIYTNNGEGVEPNVLIIFDNSGSMNQEIQVAFYDPLITYPDHLGVDPNTVFYYSRGKLGSRLQELNRRHPLWDGKEFS
jgi:hypothetical protein